MLSIRMNISKEDIHDVSEASDVCCISFVKAIIKEKVKCNYLLKGEGTRDFERFWDT